VTTLKTDENRVRRKAARRGLTLQKSRTPRSWLADARYRLLDPRYNHPLVGKRYDASLSEIERHLDNLGSR
jgi:hypothetical protein